MRARLLIGAITIVACGGSSAPPHDLASASGGETPAESPRPIDVATAEGTGAEEAPGPEVPYDRAIQKSVHNAYERFEPILDQLVYHRVRSLELDIHVRRDGMTAPSGDWFVFHEDNPVMRLTSCDQLSDCLGQIAAFHGALPRHEVVTIFVDLKDAFAAGHRASDLDGAFIKALGRDAIATPADVLAACAGATTLRDAVTGACRFPTLRALRGKFILAITGGSSCDASSLVANYGGADPLARVAFLAPEVDRSRCTVDSYDARPNIVLFNMPLAEKACASDVKSRGLVARIFSGTTGGLNSTYDFDAAKTAGAIHLATDKVSFDEDGWAATHLARGFPFTCEGCAGDLVEPGAVLGIRAKSGDQFGAADSAVFAYERDDAEAIYQALVSVPSSHVEPFAKACLVARASDEPGAASVAVCRPFDESPVRAQVRASRGASTTSVNAPAFDGVTTESAAFLRLSVKAAGAGSEVTASASRDGRFWSEIHRVTLSVPLPLRGATVSSHGNAAVKGLFANLVRERGGTRTTITKGMLEQKAIGTGSSGDVFDGIFPP